MAGFALSADEIASICRTLAAQTDGVPDQVAEIKASELGESDFGGTRYADLFRRYTEVTQHTIPGLLTEYAAAGRELADRLASTLRAYQETDAEAARALGAGRADG